MGFVVIVLAAWNQTKPPVRGDVIEVNRVTYGRDTPQLEQVIVWEWSPDYRRLDCIGYRITNVDRIALTTRGVRADGTEFVGPVIYTVTSHDPEIAARRLLPCDKRGRLTCQRGTSWRH